MDVFSQNIAFLKENDPESFDIYQKMIAELPNDNRSIRVCTNRAGQNNVVICSNGDERYVHSQYNTLIEAERWVDGINPEAELIVIIGLGLGYHIAALNKRLKASTEVFVIEPDIRIFQCLLLSNPIGDIFSRENTKLILANRMEEIIPWVFNAYKRRVFVEPEFRIYSQYSLEFSDLLKRILTTFSDLMRDLTVNLNTHEYFKELWIENHLRNIISLNGAYNGKGMKDIFRGIPAVLVSAGPSLERNLEQLRNLNDKCVIFAGGSAYRILKKNNIHPHFAVVIDGSPLIMDIYRDSDSSGTSLIYLNRCYHGLPESFSQNRIVFVDTNDTLTRKFTDRVHLPLHCILPDSTVAGTAVEEASFFGCDPIVLVGQDFAFTDLKMHADGAAHNMNIQKRMEEDGQIISTIDIYGRDTHTSKAFLASRTSMEQKVARAIANGHTFFNATEGGIGVDQCTVRSFSQIKQEYLSETHFIDKIIHEFYINKSQQILIHDDDLVGYFSCILHDAQKLSVMAKRLHADSISMKEILEQHRFHDGKHLMLAKLINKRQEELETNKFYLEYVVGTIEHTIAIHKIIMNHELANKNNNIEQNLARITFIEKQCIETIAVCNFIGELGEELCQKARSQIGE